MSGLLNSASAISAALRMDCAATAALPVADSGRMSAALTLPSPILLAGCAGVFGAGPEPRSPIPEQPASRAIDARAASHAEARAGREDEACRTAYIRADLRDDDGSCRRHAMAAIAFWPRVVNQMKSMTIFLAADDGPKPRG